MQTITTRISCIIVPWENFWFLYHLSPSQLCNCEYKGRLLKKFVFLWKERARLPVNDLRLLAINTEWIFFSSRFFLTDFDKIVFTEFDKIVSTYFDKIVATDFDKMVSTYFNNILKYRFMFNAHLSQTWWAQSLVWYDYNHISPHQPH